MNENDLEIRLRTALQAEPPAEQLARLEDFWLRQVRADGRRRRVRLGVVMAASLAAIGAIATWVLTEDRMAESSVATKGTPQAVQESPNPSKPDSVQIAESTPIAPEMVSPSPGRAPTAYEQAMFAMLSRQPIDAEASRLAATVDAAIDQAAREPKSDVAQLVESKALHRTEVERLLLDRLARTNGSKQIAVVRLLGVCGTPRALPALLALGDRESLRPPVMDSIENLVGVDHLASVVTQARHPGLRAALLRRMLTVDSTDSDAALRGFLSLVSEGPVGAEALAAADSLPNPPIEALVALLHDGEKRVRLSAAVVLGHMNGPEVTATLIRLVRDEPSAPAEVWVALLACRGESADRFLATASQEPRWLGHVNNARIMWARMVQ